jgi:hypothetical protein
LGGTVNTIAIDSNDNVYAGGTFYTLGDLTTSTNNVAKWTPSTSTWSVLGGPTVNGVNNTVNSLAIDSSDNVYVGGSFNIINNGTISNNTNNAVTNSATITFGFATGLTLVIGMSVSIVGYPYSNLKISTITSQTNITVSNNITIPSNRQIYFSNTQANNVAKWIPSTSTWSVLGGPTVNGVNNTVNALAIDFSDNVYVGGSFNIINNGTISNNTNIAVNNSLTITFGSATFGLTLVIGMSVSIVGYPYSNLKISGVTSPTDITVSSFITIPANTQIYFSNTTANNVAKWIPSGLSGSWSALISTSSINGVNNIVKALAIDSSDNVYIGGSFTKLGNDSTIANFIAKWIPDTLSWLVLGTSSANGVSGGSGSGGSGSNTAVNALAIDFSDNVYISGNFTKLSGTTTVANYVAKWTSSTNTLSTVGGEINTNILNGLPTASSTIAINKQNNTIYTGDSSTVYQLFSDYINLQYNGILLRQLYLNGQIISVYTNNNNGKKMCSVIIPSPIYQNYF